MTSALSWAAMRATLMFQQEVRMDKVTWQCPQTTTFLRKRESRSGIEPRSFRLPAWRLTTRPNRLTDCPSWIPVTYTGPVRKSVGAVQNRTDLLPGYCAGWDPCLWTILLSVCGASPWREWQRAMQQCVNIIFTCLDWMRPENGFKFSALKTVDSSMDFSRT